MKVIKVPDDMHALAVHLAKSAFQAPTTIQFVVGHALLELSKDKLAAAGVEPKRKGAGKAK